MTASNNPNGLRCVLPNAGGGFAVQGSEIAAATVDSDNIVANSMSSGQVAKNLIQTATVALTAAQLIAMYTTPVVLIAAQGSGRTIVLLDAVFAFTGTATQFTGGGTTVIQYDSTTHGAGVSPLTTFANTVIQSASSSIQQMQSAAGTVIASNKGIYISNDTAAFAAGTGTAIVHLTYKVISA